MTSSRLNNKIHIESNDGPLVYNQNLVKDLSEVKDAYEINKKNSSIDNTTYVTKPGDKKKFLNDSTLEYNLNKLKN